ncbi:putative OPA3-like protein CG13603 [Mercenaria mercenaria]|uniref:putative OPA3-like protein CG13603 n=1 Tax=Mercenaria mercenaria TaxID=6596 RepID=UPI001E1D33A3|nr:putative OPA3-like protein CG13603 [Mercenaria mercenaria]
MPFPLAKLVALGLRQASRHVANFVKVKAKDNETFRKILVKSAGWYHTIQTKSRLDILGMGKVKKVTPLSEQAAIDLGVEILGDTVVIVCALAIYILIEARSSKHKEHEEELKEEEMRSLKELVVFQSIELETQGAKLREFERILNGSTMYSKTSERVVAEFSQNEQDSVKT